MFSHPALVEYLLASLLMNRLFISASLVACLSVGTLAQTFDLANDFSATTQGNNGWTYGWSANQNVSTFNLFASHAVPNYRSDIRGWTEGAGTYSYIVKNEGATDYNFGGVANFEAGKVAFHPGNTSLDGFTVARWTSSISGAAVINTGFFTRFENANGQSTWAVLLNGVFLGSGTLSGFNASGGLLNRMVSLNLGDTVDFVVGNGGDGYTSDVNRVDATIQAVPEPFTLGLGLAAAGLFVRRRATRSRQVAV